jgi:hypothetical protein
MRSIEERNLSKTKVPCRHRLEKKEEKTKGEKGDADSRGEMREAMVLGVSIYESGKTAFLFFTL